MPETFDIPDDVERHLSEKDCERVDRADRNVQIRKGFERLREQGASKTLAYQKLAFRQNCSVSLVRKVLNGER